MIYSDSENIRWFEYATKQRIQDCLNAMGNGGKIFLIELACSLEKQWKAGVTLSAKQIAAIRKWDSEK